MGIQTFPAASGGAKIKSIQRGEITIAGSASSGTAAISSVVTSLAEVSFLGTSGFTSVEAALCRVHLNSATQMGASRDTPSTNSARARYEVTEWTQ